MEKLEPDFCTHQELEALLAAATNLRHRTMILLLADAGLKATEVCRLTWASFDFRARTLAVPPRAPRQARAPRASAAANPTPPTQPKAPKPTPKPRLVPVSDRLSATLTDLLQAEPPADRTTYLFPSKTKPGEPIGRGAVNDMLVKLRDRVPGSSPEPLHPKRLRNTFTAVLQLGGAKPTELKQVLGQQTLPPHLRQNGTPMGQAVRLELLRQQLNASRPKPSFGRQVLTFFLPGLPRKRNPWAEFDNTRLVGRDAEATHVLDAVSRHISVLLVGGVGVGKSHLLDTLKFERPVLSMDDTKDFKKSLAGILLYLFDGDKEQAAALFYKDLKRDGNLVAHVNKETVPAMCRILMSVTQPGEYVLKIGEIDGITPTVVRALELLKDHFTIVTTTRGVKAINAGFIWNFERVEVQNLSRAHTLRLVHYLTEELTPDDKQYLANKVWDTSEGNPRMVQELCGRFRKEPTLTNEDVADICGNYLGKQTREIDMSIFLLVIFGGLSLLRYVSRESHNTSLRFLGGVAMVLLMFGRYFFNASRRKTF